MIRPAILSLLFAAPALAQAPVPQGAPNADFAPAFSGQTRAPALDSGVALRAETLAAGLAHPWGIAPLPGGGYLVTERPGTMRYVARDGTVSAPIAGVPAVHAVRQGGLLDVAVAPDFAASRAVYFTYSKPLGGGRSVTAAARGVLSADATRLAEVEDIFVQAPPSPTPMHYGARILVHEGHVFVTTGEHSSGAERVLAQDPSTTYGKVIRIGPDGGVPAGNPFAGAAGAVSTIWSLGHRNIQGAAIRPETGQLWAIEHGPRGGDELNLIEPGGNYGWPVVSYGINYSGTAVGTGEADHAGRGFVEPVYYWDPVIAPGGMVFYDGAMFPAWRGDLLIGGLQAGAVVRLEMDGDRVVGEERLAEGIGRVRDVEVAPDGALLVLIDARRGRILRLSAEE